jgi:hypothetical protein
MITDNSAWARPFPSYTKAYATISSLAKINCIGTHEVIRTPIHSSIYGSDVRSASRLREYKGYGLQASYQGSKTLQESRPQLGGA